MYIETEIILEEKTHMIYILYVSIYIYRYIYRYIFISGKIFY